MLKNYLIIAIRNIRRNKTYSFINIAGLAVGMAAAIIILLFVENELTYDKFHQNADRIYRVNFTWGDNINAGTPEPVASGLLAEFPEVEHSVRITPPNREVLVRAGDRVLYEEGFMLADPAFFDMFSFEAVAGNIASALESPNSIVITTAIAEKYFGDNNPIGRQLETGDGKMYQVTAVIEPVPANSHLAFDIVAHRPLSDAGGWNPTASLTARTYVLLRENSDIANFEEKLPGFVQENARSLVLTEGEDGIPYTSGSVPVSEGHGWGLELQSLADIHLHSDFDSPVKRAGPFLYIYLFSAMALFILLIACANYTNLATSRYLHRAREIGVRKIVGAHRDQISRQILGEAVITSLIAAALALTIVELVLPLFNALLGSALVFRPFGNLSHTLLIMGIPVLVGLTSGGYPAILFSAQRPAQILHPMRTGLSTGTGLRRGLILFQFTASIALILGTIAIHRQLTYIRTTRLNVRGDQVVVIANRDRLLGGRYNEFESRLRAQTAISYVTATRSIPGAVGTGMQITDGDGNQLNFNMITIGPEFVKTLGLTIIEGRDFSEEDVAAQRSNQRPYIMNERGVRAVGLEQPIGADFMRGNVIGVVQDYYLNPIYESIGAVLMTVAGPDYVPPFVLVRLQGDHIAEGLDQIRSVWQDFVPDRPLQYSFLDEELDAMYRAELRLGQLSAWFAGLAIIIASLGLFGLAAFAAERRTKEIGIRKVVGASVGQIVGLLCKEFIILVLIANVIAWPVAWYAMNRWLENFAYRIDLGLGTFILAGLLALVIALATVSYQAIKAATANPVDALRYE